MTDDRRRIALAGYAEEPGGHSDDTGVVEALAAAGIDASWRVWDDPSVAWADFEAVVIRQTWDYTSKHERFLAWVGEVEAVTLLLNPGAVIRWNHHKRYLLELADDGIPVVPSILVPAGSAPPAVPWDDAIVKPAVGVGGNDIERIAGGEPLAVADRDRLVQPYLRTIETAGETSLIVLGGEPSHTLVKRPASGEYRAHEHRGGTYEVADPRPDQLDVARAAWAAAVRRTGAEPLLGRVDLVDGDDGRPLLGELELIEPSLYLHHVPAAAGTLAQAIRGRLPGPRS